MASFEGSYENLKSSSADLNAILANLPAGLADGERRARISQASSAYEDARLEFTIAAATLNEFVLAGSARPAMHAATA